MLNDLGYAAGKTDGQNNSELQDAVRSFQTDNALTVTGQLSDVGLGLLQKFHEVSFGVSTGGNQQVETVTPTNSNANTDMARHILKRLGYWSGETNGYSNAVAKFQSDAGLDVTGEIDTATYRKLIEAEEYIFDDFIPYWKEQASQIKRAKKIKNIIESQPALIVSFLAGAGSKAISGQNDLVGSLKRLVRPSVPLIACYGTSTTVIGFYNVVQNLWVLVWIDEHDTIISSMVITGLDGHTSEHDGSWLSFYADGSSFAEALRRSFDKQVQAFQKRFDGETCSGSSYETISTEYDHSDIQVIVKKNAVSDGISDKLLDQINNKTRVSESVEDGLGLILMAALEASATEDYDVLSFHSMEVDPSVIIIQAWKVNNNGPTLVARTAVDLMREFSDEN